MGKIQFPLYLEKKLIDEIQEIMNLKLINEKGYTVYRLFEGNSKQQWYRELLTLGLYEKIKKFEKRKKEITEDES